MSTIAHEPTDVILRDGSTLRLRAPLDSDADALLEFFEQLSDNSRYLRFHGFPHLGPDLVQPMLDPDWTERGALVGELGGRIVALASYVRLRDAATAEAAFAVDDELQGRGGNALRRVSDRRQAIAAQQDLSRVGARLAERVEARNDVVEELLA